MLSDNAEKLIKEYFNLPFPGMDGVRTPYFNNARKKQRGQLKVLVGKGTPKEIVEEAQIISVQYHLGFFDKSGECCIHRGEAGCERLAPKDIHNFLVDRNLGVDCSGFASQVLRQHFLDSHQLDIAKTFVLARASGWLRRLVAKLRPIENMGVRVWAEDANTEVVTNWQDIQVVDVIVALQTGPEHKRNHILVVTNVIKREDEYAIQYVHARAWPSEGKYNHGVARGEIKINTNTGSIVDGIWEELGKVGEANETWTGEIKNAVQVQIRRVRI